MQFKVEESIHIDDWTCKKEDRPSLSGVTGELKIVEERSGMLFGIAIKRKSKETYHIINTIKFLERQIGRKLKVIYCDNAP